MLISHSHRFIFFHVAKTGGISVRRALEPYAEEPERFKIPRPARMKAGKPNPFYGVWEAMLLHAKASDAQRELPVEVFEPYFKFAFVRNPWDLQVSMYHFILREETHIRHALVRSLGSFEAYLEWLVQTPNPFPKGATRLQQEPLIDATGRLLVDFVGRYEHLAEDFEQVCQHLRLSVQLPHLNRTEHQDFRRYYTDATRALVARHFAEDIERFGYTFDGPVERTQTFEMNKNFGQPLKGVASPNAAALPADVSQPMVEGQTVDQKAREQQLREQHWRNLLRARRVVKAPEPVATPTFDRPIFIVSSPRSGSTLLFETLRHLEPIWTTGGENHETLESIPGLHPAEKGFVSNRLDAQDATPEVAVRLNQRFTHALRNHVGTPWLELDPAHRPPSVRFLEKTPKNSLRIPFLHALYPDARFVFLSRAPEETISSMIEGWQEGRFVGYRELPSWPHGPWSFLLVPGWQELAGLSLEERVAQQWAITMSILLEDLHSLPRTSWHRVDYQALVTSPQETIETLVKALELPLDPEMRRRLEQPLPISSMTTSPPAPGKWRRHAAALERVMPGLLPLVERVAQL